MVINYLEQAPPIYYTISILISGGFKMKEKEIWKDVIGYKGYYQVSNLGQVRSIDRMVSTKNGGLRLAKGKILKSCTTRFGYEKVRISMNNEHKTTTVHILIAQAFIPNPDNKPQVNHIDGNKLNNHVSNLKWVTREENMQHAVKSGLREKTYRTGFDCPNSKAPILQLDLQGNIVGRYGSMREMCRRNPKLDRRSVHRVMKGEYKQHHGFTFEWEVI